MPDYFLAGTSVSQWRLQDFTGPIPQHNVGKWLHILQRFNKQDNDEFISEL